VLNAQFEQDGPLVFEHACLLGCEGIVSKRKDSRYRWPLAPLAEVQKSGGTGSQTRSRGSRKWR
jgi:hypothetical protein